MTDKVKDVDRVIWQTAVNALNDLHHKHGIDEAMKCSVCTSQTAEMTIARHFQKMVDKLKPAPTIEKLQWDTELRANIEKKLRVRNEKLKSALDRITWISKHPFEG